VLAAFMAGLGGGSLAFASWLDRTRTSALRAYALMEWGIAASALALPLLPGVLLPVLETLYRSEASPPALAGVRFAGALLFLIVPTALMGGTLPALARHRVTRAAAAERPLAALYAANTWGGLAGTLLCGFVLIPALGMRRTNLLAVLLNAVVGLAAWVLASRGGGRGPIEEAPAREAGRVPRLVLAAFFVSGLAALATEVIGVRVLLLVFGSTTYAFTVMLATFLAGIGLGSALMALWLRRRPPATTTATAVVLLASAVLLLAASASVDRLPALYLEALRLAGATWAGDVAARTLVSLVFLLPVAALFGAMFPLVAGEEVRRRGSAARGVAAAYAANTAGAILGSLAGGFALLPALGMQKSLGAVALLLASTGLAVLASGRPRPALIATALAVTTAALALASRPWDRKLLSAGVYMAPHAFLGPHPGRTLREALARQRLTFFREGKTATVSVVELPGSIRSFRVDGKTEISDLPADRRLGRMMGHLPMLLHPAPRAAVNIGLGAGLTVGALAAHPLTTIDVVEIEPEVAGAARMFSAENHDVLSDPRLRLVVNDGRNHLLLTDRRYDVVTSDPFEPTVAGAASLFTLEHFRLGRDRLAPGGIMCQWLPLYELGPAEFDSIARTFAMVFPSVSVWFTGRDTLLIGSMQPPVVDLERVAARMREPAVRRDLADVGYDDPYRLLGSFLYTVDGPDDFPPGVAINTDDVPVIEFAAPKRRWLSTVPAHLQRLLPRKQAPPPFVVFPTDEARRQAERSFAAQTLAMHALVEAHLSGPEAARPLAMECERLDPGNPLAAELLGRR
jgi:spermidine synthase